MTLRVQLLILQALIVCLTTAATGIVAGTLQEHAIRDAYKDRMQAVAQSVAALPAITGAFDSANPSAVIQPIAEVIREASDLTYVVVANAAGIRYSHPNPERIGERVSTDPSIPLSGQIYVGTQTGTLGTTWRVKVPIYDAQHEVIGTASVGILETELNAEFLASLVWLIGAMILSAALGVFGAAWVAAFIRRRIHRLEPNEIASLVENRETTLHRLSEGVISVDVGGTITLVNDAAARLIDADAGTLQGSRAREVLAPGLVAILEDGEPAGRPVLVGTRMLVARSTGARVGGLSTEATLLLRDHTELHDMLQRIDAADAILAWRARFGLPKGLSGETLDRVHTALRRAPNSSANDVGAAVGISRVSARRYLEYLASAGGATRDLDYATSGRPTTRYSSVDAQASPTPGPSEASAADDITSARD